MLLYSRYQVEQTIGQGGMGVVYSAIDIVTEQKVAIKKISSDYYQSNSELLSIVKERLQREYYFLSRINHPNVVKACDFFEEKGHLFLVLEFIEGILLSDFIKKQKKSLSLQGQIGIACQICKGIEVINTAGIIHRDIKPGNIIINTRGGIVKILDLGVAKSEQEGLQTITGGQVGTPDYMSPEQIDNDVQMNSDVFSLAVVLYQFFLWLDHSPFKSDTPTATMYKVINDHLPFINMYTNTHPEEYIRIAEIISSALEKDYQKRTQTVRELGNQLREVYLAMVSQEQNTTIPFVTEGKQWILSEGTVDNLAQIGINFKSHKKPTKQKEAKQVKLKKRSISTRRYKEESSSTSSMILIIALLAIIPVVFMLRNYYIEKNYKLEMQLKEQRFKEMVEQGDTFVQQKNYDQAIKYYQKAIELELNKANSFYFLGKTYYQKKNYKLAIANYKKAMELEPQNSKFYDAIGHLYFYQKDYSKAIKHYEKAIELGFKEAKSFHYLADSYYQKENYKSAIVYYKKTIELEPRRLGVNYSLGNAYYHEKKFNYVVSHYEKEIEINPKNLKAHGSIAEFYLNRKSHIQATEQYYKIIHKNLKYGIGLMPIEDHHKKADTIVCFENVIKRTPKDFRAYSLLGVIYLQNDNLEKAEKFSKEAIRLNTEDAVAHRNLGTIYNETQNFNVAIKHLKKAITIQPQFPMAYSELGVAYDGLKKSDKAIANLKKAIELDPLMHDVYNDIGNVYQDKKDFSKAVEYYEMSIKIDPSYIPGHANKGLTLYKDKKFKQALESLNTAVSLGLKHSLVTDHIKLCKEKLSQDK